MKLKGVKIYGRERWGARTPREMTIDGPKKEMFLHYSDGQGLGIDSLKEQIFTMKSLQNFHMDTRGWSDIAYDIVVFQPYGRLRRARAFEGRVLKYVPAAQLNHNTGTIPVCVVMREGEPLKPATKRLLKAIYKALSVNTVRGHFEVVETSCPGTALKAFLPELKKVK